MADDATEALERETAEMALRALEAAQKRAMASGRPVVLVDNDELVRIDQTGRTLLCKLPPRRKVSVRRKYASR